MAAAVSPTPAAAGVAAAPAGIELRSVVPFTTVQGAVSRNMVENLAVPAFRVGYTITNDALDALYKKIKSNGVTMMALLAKATALTLVQHPVVNSSCRDGNRFTYNSSINIAVAGAIDGRLITPVLQDADKVDICKLSRKCKELVDKAHVKQLQPHEYNTGTLTLSNLGMFGADRFDGVLPPGTGAIMAVGASEPTVVATKDGRIGMKNQMQVNVTADHRVIYGTDLASFLQTLAKIIEDPKDLTFLSNIRITNVSLLALPYSRISFPPSMFPSLMFDVSLVLNPLTCLVKYRKNVQANLLCSKSYNEQEHFYFLFLKREVHFL